jgi:phenylalanyl-tRNA synthetase beta chain
MRFALSWLRDWVELPEKISEISDLLMKVGVGLEAIDDPSIHMANVVTVRVVKREAHPNADKLSVAQVFDGTQTLQIVCGAKNFKEGDLVALAKEGAVLPGDFKIKRSKIRDVESFGMLCSAEELGLGKAEEGLMILDPKLQPGTPLAQALGLDDPIFTLETTANRPDHLSVRGLAREISALTGKALKNPPLKISEGGGAIEKSMTATIADTEACRFYSARIARKLTVGPSPIWLRSRVEGAGIRSINNVVDITNYVLIEYGQPLHAFDLKKLEGGSIQARLATAGETLETLDHQKRVLEAGDIVIADGKKIVALGGVMGGAATEVSPDTTEILLEAAVFKPVQIRRTSRRLNLRSEASLRFERGVDPAASTEALDRACALLSELAQAQIAPGRLELGLPPAKPHSIAAKVSRINALLGSAFSAEAMAGLLTRRGFEASISSEQLVVSPPSWRGDVREEVDLSEEVAHLAGLDALPSTFLPEVRTPDSDAIEVVNSLLLKDLLKSQGLSEASSLTYLDPTLAKAWGMESSCARINNPWSLDMSLLRPSLLPNLSRCALESIQRQASGVALFELGHVFEFGGKQIGESASLGALLAGQAGDGHWSQKARPFDFYDLKGVAEALAEGLKSSLRNSQEKKPPSYLHPGQSARIYIGAVSGWMGAMHPALALDLGFKAPVYLLELAGWASKELLGVLRYKDFNRLPSVERDLSCLVDLGFQAGQLLETLKKEGGFSSKHIRLKDVYQGEALPPGKKSLTVSLTYEPVEVTLTDEAVNLRHESLCQRLREKLPLEIRV